MRFFVIFSLWSLVLYPWSFADVYLRDVPEGHWAYEAVYDLVKSGVIGGFPDGTFRGKQNITRYEVASFLSKLARHLRAQQGVREKLIAELKSEVSYLTYKEQKNIHLNGELIGNWKGGRTPTQKGGKANYRLKLQVDKNFAQVAGLKINLDTLDTGFYGGSRSLIPELLDLESYFKWREFTVKVTSGPNEMTHSDDGLFPSENNLIYLRPERSLTLLTSTKQTEFSLGYIIHNTDSSGKVTVAEINSALTQIFPFFAFSFSPTLFVSLEGERDLRLKGEGEIKKEGWGIKFLSGIAKIQDFPRGLYFKGELEIENALHLVFQKIGSQYREKFGHSILDFFDRGLADGTTNWGIELKKSLPQNWLIKFKGNLTDPGSTLTNELSLGYNINKNYSLVLFYQGYRSFAFSEILGLEVSCQL